jgi:hypothetical protein
MHASTHLHSLCPVFNPAAMRQQLVVQNFRRLERCIIIILPSCTFLLHPLGRALNLQICCVGALPDISCHSDSSVAGSMVDESSSLRVTRDGGRREATSLEAANVGGGRLWPCGS